LNSYLPLNAEENNTLVLASQAMSSTNFKYILYERLLSALVDLFYSWARSYQLSQYLLGGL